MATLFVEWEGQVCRSFRRIIGLWRDLPGATLLARASRTAVSASARRLRHAVRPYCQPKPPNVERHTLVMLGEVGR